MTTPTLSMQIFGEMQREKGRKRERSEAAKKAWRTRRRMAKVSPKMLAVMRAIFLERRYLTLTYLDASTVAHTGINGINPDGSSFGLGTGDRLRVSYSTFRAMEKRGWLEYHRRRATGTSTDLSGRTRTTWALDYRLSDKGRKMFHKAEGNP